MLDEALCFRRCLDRFRRRDVLFLWVEALAVDTNTPKSRNLQPTKFPVIMLPSQNVDCNLALLSFRKDVSQHAYTMRMSPFASYQKFSEAQLEKARQRGRFPACNVKRNTSGLGFMTSLIFRYSCGLSERQFLSPDTRRA